MNSSFSIKGNLVNISSKKINYAEVRVEKERITGIEVLGDEKPGENYLLPGFIDAHIHIESSMLVPSEFARLAVVHGTVATVSDPHEIANVCGRTGVEFMIEDGKKVPFKFNFGAPSCVPATMFETAGATLDSTVIGELLRMEEILYLSEMMNFPGVLNGDKEVMDKIAAAKKFGKPVDGHAPGLRGEEAGKYISAGISTDHECFTKEEALDKLSFGMKIIIREGSAAKNFESLVELLHDHSDFIMFCSDDKHPDSLVISHIDQLCARAIKKGIDPFKILKAACVNPVEHYKLKVGLLRINDFADFILVKDLRDFQVEKTFINGQLVAENGQSRIEKNKAAATSINQFNCTAKKASDFIYPATNVKDRIKLPVIEALDGQLITNKMDYEFEIENGILSTVIADDILKIVVVNRYTDGPIAKAFIKNFGLKAGAIASSVAHDSHNIVAIGVDDASIAKAVNLVIAEKGGISCVTGKEHSVLPLPVAGLMSAEDGYVVAEKYGAIDQQAKALGSKLSAPFMTLSFMALLVIPHIKLSDKGLFDGDVFSFYS
jgi:adenine deaminase